MAIHKQLVACAYIALLSAPLIDAGHLHRHLMYQRRAIPSTATQQPLESQILNLASRLQVAESMMGITDQNPLAPLEPLTPGPPSPTPSPVPASITTSPSSLAYQGVSSTPSAVAAPDLASSSSSITSTTASLAVYFGSTANTTADGLLPLCADPAISIVNLAFVSQFFIPKTVPAIKPYPSVSFGPGCTGPNAVQSRLAPGLQDCSALGAQITACQQQYNTKILVSLGGYIASSAFSSDSEAEGFATTLWNLFGAGTPYDHALRPFGSAIVDGFDIDNEDDTTSHWLAFATALKAHYATDKSRHYYIGAAPQCPRPDASIPESVMKIADFVWVQFYNNPSCNANAGAGFADSVAAWSSDLATGANGGPQLFIGMGAWPGAGSGYVEPSQLASTVAVARQNAPKNFGGVMLWDGTVGAQDGYVGAVSAALA